VLEERAVGSYERRIGDDRVRGDQAIEGIASPCKLGGGFRQRRSRSVRNLEADPLA
jgi:hypothetical protein